MTPQLRNLLILLCGIAVVLLLVVLLFGGNGPLTRFLSFFLEEDDSIPHTRNTGRSGARKSRRSSQSSRTPAYTGGADTAQAEDTGEQKKTSEPVVEMATLIQRSDDRLRVIENSGRIRMIDEYYELLFINRKGQKLKIQCSPEVYEKIPFDVQGSLTYRRSTLVKFKLYDKTYFNDGRVEDSGNPVYSSAGGSNDNSSDEQTSGS
ncbi:MAG: hypothetical protein IJ874_03830 [Ruminococcus sp.]|nr:hypothetical protein [Ruminococcus sp.]